MQYLAGRRWHVVFTVSCSAASPSKTQHREERFSQFLQSIKPSQDLPMLISCHLEQRIPSAIPLDSQAPISRITSLGQTSRFLLKPSLETLPFLCALLKIYYPTHYAVHFLLCLPITLRSREGLLYSQSINRCFLSINGSGTPVVTPLPATPGIHTSVRYLFLVLELQGVKTMYLQ